jgi:hypothetical protein
LDKLIISTKQGCFSKKISKLKHQRKKIMIISDLNHLEVVDNCAVVGGSDVANAGNITLDIKKQLQQTSYNTLNVTAVNIQKSPLTQSSYNDGALNTNVSISF